MCAILCFADLAFVVEIILVQQPSGLQRGLGAGWDLILPAGWGTRFWNALVQAGARAVGM